MAATSPPVRRCRWSIPSTRWMVENPKQAPCCSAEPDAGLNSRNRKSRRPTQLSHPGALYVTFPSKVTQAGVRPSWSGSEPSSDGCPIKLACVAHALPISISRTEPCVQRLHEVYSLTPAAVTQVGTCAHLASSLRMQRRVPGQGEPSVALLRQKLPPTAASPAVEAPAGPQVIFLPHPAPSRVIGAETSCSRSC